MKKLDKSSEHSSFLEVKSNVFAELKSHNKKLSNLCLRDPSSERVAEQQEQGLQDDGSVRDFDDRGLRNPGGPRRGEEDHRDHRRAHREHLRSAAAGDVQRRPEEEVLHGRLVSWCVRLFA